MEILGKQKISNVRAITCRLRQERNVRRRRQCGRRRPCTPFNDHRVQIPPAAQHGEFIFIYSKLKCIHGRTVYRGRLHGQNQRPAERIQASIEGLQRQEIHGKIFSLLCLRSSSTLRSVEWVVRLPTFLNRLTQCFSTAGPRDVLLEFLILFF